METVAEAIDLDGLLIAAGLKAGAGFGRCRRRAATAPPRRSISPNPRATLPARVARFLAAENWAGEVFAGEALARGRVADRHGDAGRGRRSPADERVNPHGVARLLPDRAGSGGQRKQDRLRPAWRARPQRAAAVPDRSTAAVSRPGERRQPTFADRHRADRAAPPAHGPRRHGRQRPAADSITIPHLSFRGSAQPRARKPMNTGPWNMGSAPRPSGDPGMTGIRALSDRV